MGSVLGFFRFLFLGFLRWLIPSWIAHDSQGRRRRRSRSVRSLKASSSGSESSGDDSSCSHSSCSQRSSRRNVPRNMAFLNSSAQVSGNRSFCNSSANSSRRERVPEVFTGTKGDLRDWFCHFETCARWNGWDYTEKGVNLAMSLRGPAQQVLGELNPLDLEDYGAIKAALERRFDPAEKENLYRVEFRSRTKRKSETVSEYGFALNRLAASAYPRMPPEAKETIVIDQFVCGLPSRELRRHVQFRHPSTVHEAIALASEFESFEDRFEGRKPENEDRLKHHDSVRSINQDKESGIEKAFRVLSDKLTAEMKKLSEALESSCRTEKKGGKTDIVCYRCGEKGHISRQCRVESQKHEGQGQREPQQGN